MAAQFESLIIEGWRQFDDIELIIHPRLTVITGANGSGKSTILSVFSRHFGFNRNYLSTPVRSATGDTSYISGILRNLWHSFRFKRDEGNQIHIGQLKYTNGVSCSISINQQNGIQYSINLGQQQQVFGIHIDSYRPAPVYSNVSQLPMAAMTADQAFANYNSEIMNRYSGAYTQSTPTFRMKEALISMAIFGEGNALIGRNQHLLETFNGFNNILAKLLPESFGFEKISVRSPEVVLVTKSGEFMLDAVSGGVMTLIDFAWRIFMFSRVQSGFVVTIDEPENHLHPSMQRSLMRRLLGAFPGVQFIIATHSPFIVSSVRDSAVYVLRYESRDGHSAENELDASRRVKSVHLDNVNKAGTASDVLREVLGVPATMPEWVEEGLSGIVSEFKGKKLDHDTIGQLRARLSEFGYDEYFPQVLTGVAGR